MEKNGLVEDKSAYPWWVRFFLAVLQCWLVVYDWIAYIPFLLFANPHDKLEKSKQLKSRTLKNGDPSSPFRSVMCKDGKLTTSIWPDCLTLGLGTREILSVEQEPQPNGKKFEKFVMGKYSWQTYRQIAQRVENVGSGITSLGLKKGDRVVIFSETRADWMITAQACFKYGYTVGTVYSTLGDEAIVHAINELEASVIFTTAELTLFPKLSKVKNAIYYESLLPNPPKVEISEDQLNNNGSKLNVQKFEELEKKGQSENLQPIAEVQPTDLALIMYTSGTTGLPKGVMIEHRNLVAASAAMSAMIPGIGFGDRYIGYLPLAHVLELVAELSCLSHGVCIGYSNPLTMHDQASKIKRGTKGDCSMLKPTLMAAVPAIMDRIYKAVTEKVRNSNAMRQALFHFLYERKRAKIEDGYDNPFLNRLVFSHIRSILGGNVRVMLSGGAPLSKETERFMNICFCCPVGQGYGLTETCGAATICSVDDLSTGRVGAPLTCSDVLLRDWDEGNYKSSNKPNPQGEVLISGGNVVAGYWKNPEKTAEDFIEIDGRRWFCTGDIGEFDPDGSLKIIDRKKDLVKLAHGEYISLARVETALLLSPYLDNICVYGNSYHSNVIALIVPNRKMLQTLAEKCGKGDLEFEDQCQDGDVVSAMLAEIQSQGRQRRLEKFEIPAKVHLCSEVWTPQMDLLTEAMKLKRKPIEKFYTDTITKLYGGKKQ